MPSNAQNMISMMGVRGGGRPPTHAEHIRATWPGPPRHHQFGEEHEPALITLRPGTPGEFSRMCCPMHEREVREILPPKTEGQTA